MIPDGLIELNVAINDLRTGTATIEHVHEVAGHLFHGLNNDAWQAWRASQWERICAVYAVTSTAMAGRTTNTTATAQLMRIMRWDT